MRRRIKVVHLCALSGAEAW